MALKIDAWNVPFVQLSSANLWVIFFCTCHGFGAHSTEPGKIRCHNPSPLGKKLVPSGLPVMTYRPRVLGSIQESSHVYLYWTLLNHSEIKGTWMSQL